MKEKKEKSIKKLERVQSLPWLGGIERGCSVLFL
jgi:hypothetical protein